MVIGMGFAKSHASISPSVYILFDSGRRQPERKDILDKKDRWVFFFFFGNWDCIFSFHKENINYTFVNQPLKTK